MQAMWTTVCSRVSGNLTFLKIDVYKVFHIIFDVLFAQKPVKTYIILKNISVRIYRFLNFSAGKMILNLISTKLATYMYVTIKHRHSKSQVSFIHSSDLKTFEKKFWMYVTKYVNNK